MEIAQFVAPHIVDLAPSAAMAAACGLLYQKTCAASDPQRAAAKAAASSTFVALALAALVRAAPECATADAAAAPGEWAACVWGTVRHSPRLLMLVGLVAGAVGDVLLELAFVPGVVAFMVGHIAYTLAFVRLHPAGGCPVTVAATAPVALAAAGWAVRRFWGPARKQSLLVPIVSYVGIIAAMVMAAAASGRPALLVGAALFGASDIGVAWATFVGPSHRTAISLVLYYQAQVTIARQLANA